MTLERVLTLRELNRTSLDRQLLIKRQKISVIEAINQLVAMQSQIPNPPYIGLWSRVVDFHKDDLTQLIENRAVVRAPLMRSTLHLVTAEAHQAIQKTIQSALEKGYRSFFGKYRDAFDHDLILTAIKPFLEEAPRSTGEMREFLLAIQPEADEAAMSYAVRTYLPLIQVFPSGTWDVGTHANYVPAEMYLGEAQEADVIGLFKRYLRGYGPASIMDFQAFTGMTNLKKRIESRKDEFVIYLDEAGAELHDLPELEIIPDSQVVPITFLPEYDNALISYKDRNRILPDMHRKKVFLSAGRVAGTVLIDGFVGATWKPDYKKGDALLHISLFDEVSDDIKDTVLAEGESLLRFIYEDAESYQVLVV